ncbi:winged helix-turn-helix domain-containing protein [Shouchella patagoniensis]|uniref:winged helix-turn-helix domain-containing protein n=1 Tax=Shouchella patagoniensis TaxID=228576 RepID=UPI000994CC67|nr:winged helix-turn-helix domain-containing protein [Shouchella patagoniensis]
MLDSMAVTLKQQKLISHPLRSNIIRLLSTTPMTAKQVADHYNKTTGSIHYHIQQLFINELLEIDHTNSINGIVEKYYRAKATHFHLENEPPTNALIQKVHAVPLTSDDLRRLNDEVSELILKYTNKKADPDQGDQIEHKITFSVEPKIT